MKNLKLFIFSMITFLLYTVGVQAQTATQTITRGDIKNYAVDTADGPNGTEGSTYTWSVYNVDSPTEVIQSGTTLTITNQETSTSGNAITIDWGTTPTGIYTLKVKEFNSGCEGDEKLITVLITPRITLEAENVTICSGEVAEFTISDAQPGSTIRYNLIIGETSTPQTIDVDENGRATISVTPPAGATEVTVTITSMTLLDNTVVQIDPVQTATTFITIITTSEIEFD